MKRRLALLALVAALVAALWWRHDRMVWPITNAPPERRGIVCYGDSLTRGAGVAPGEAWPALLARFLGLPPSEVLSRGRDGRTLGEARAELDREVLSTGAGTAIILLGGNDQLRGVDPGTALRDLEVMVDELHERRWLVVICDFSPLGLGLQRAWARGFADIARRHGCVLVPGVADGLYSGGTETQGPDRIHLNASGQRALAERIARATAPHLGMDPEAVERRIAGALTG